MTKNPNNYNVILSPVVTEKSTKASENNQVVFKVAVDSNKKSIKESVEKIFKVKVDSVNIINSKGKVKVVKGKKGRRKNEKKAIISLKEGQTIDFSGGV